MHFKLKVLNFPYFPCISNGWARPRGL